MDATFVQGLPVMVPHTPTGGNVAVGEIVLIGNTAGWTCGVAHAAIVNNTQGDLSCGGGVYDVKVASNYAKGSKVYWDDANAVLTTTSTNMSLFGHTVETSPAANSIVKVLHKPYV